MCVPSRNRSKQQNKQTHCYRFWVQLSFISAPQLLSYREHTHWNGKDNERTWHRDILQRVLTTQTQHCFEVFLTCTCLLNLTRHNQSTDILVLEYPLSMHVSFSGLINKEYGLQNCNAKNCQVITVTNVNTFSKISTITTTANLKKKNPREKFTSNSYILFLLLFCPSHSILLTSATCMIQAHKTIHTRVPREGASGSSRDRDWKNTHYFNVGFLETWKLFQGFFRGKKVEKGWHTISNS